MINYNHKKPKIYIISCRQIYRICDKKSGNFAAFETLYIFASADKKLFNSVISNRIIKIYVPNKSVSDIL